ncbi:bifunctional transcriptional regulator/glucokinase [bacterium M00.F.Ca.ET.228.01.1.1]|uniref:bifunctional transcriptional regulator/glucokinase n=1 Tax=Paraburkholderia phenoliruptrix TaxID=252970 RepID=UPI001092CCAC|nr:bifunctional transcriptional regulator/glucokinase [Paraburkholderia phenoliruptrix]TGP43228.1 bifunctional transcriptional regulator/glucokinase [bacterium M00.F.Ca.ET.228.01.1.1]TGS00667.1 bifunctional transcriptional regulator/glucokinase [bacterium M00.F.Ca.ET.191.01.1.1]TGU05053.1 bifunctional transcriptional regulator/glucokinase [bacterium M00.F.Ca.ET.155.01.1.1]MBW0446835.1 bifunctional transcriptional regulator/glucokinase [Paraburkholderia phenoliruptrix]MBW9099331.1 bifunctional 
MSTGVQTKAVPGAGQHADGPRLLADIGGTNARFALETGPGEIGSVQVYPCADYPGVADVIKKYLKDMKIGRVNHAAIAIANPVDGDQVSMTNHDWTFSIEATRRALGFDTLLVVNDFTALAMALPGLTDSQRVQVGGGTRRPNSVIGLLGPGTGMGVSGLIPADDRWIALGSEGGHATFAPADEREDIVLQYARKKWSHVSFERVAAGPGIEVIYRALAGRDKKRVAATVDTREIVKRALDGEPLAAESVDVFCGILGTFAGNIAVTLGALGGIYIGGGVVPRLGEFFARSSFRKRFEAKGRFEAYLQNVPTYVITAEYPAFLGVSAILAEQLSNRAGGSSSAVFERIRQMRDALTPAERRVADLALNHPRSIINDPIVDIARKADVSQPTVIRFCRSLGCQGLSDFKLKLATGLTGTIPVSHSQVHLGDTATDFGAKVLDNTVSAILQLREHLNFEHVERAIDLLNGARRIEFYGLGNSNIVAQDAHYKFFRFGIPTIAYGDLYMQAASAALLGKGDVIVAVSKSGRAPELLRVLDVAMQAGAKVIAITSSNTPLAKRATVALETDHIEIRESQLSMISRILHLVMIDILAVGVAIRRAAPSADVAETVAKARQGADDDASAVLDWLSHGAASSARD